MNTSKIAGVDVSTEHFIDGKRVASKQTFEDCSPIDGQHLADVSAGGAAEVDAAVAAAADHACLDALALPIKSLTQCRWRSPPRFRPGTE